MICLIQKLTFQHSKSSRFGCDTLVKRPSCGPGRLWSRSAHPLIRLESLRLQIDKHSSPVSTRTAGSSIVPGHRVNKKPKSQRSGNVLGSYHSRTQESEGRGYLVSGSELKRGAWEPKEESGKLYRILENVCISCVKIALTFYVSLHSFIYGNLMKLRSNESLKLRFNGEGAKKTFVPPDQIPPLPHLQGGVGFLQGLGREGTRK